MPTYEYACPDCGNRFEIVQRIDDEALTVCEVCGGKLRKLYFPAGIVFKGSGFYATDSRKRARSGKEAAADGKDKKKKEKKEGTAGSSSDSGSTSSSSDTSSKKPAKETTG